MKRILTLLILLCSYGAIAQTYVPLYGLTAVSGTNTYTASVTPTPTLTNGLKIAVKFTNGNSGAATFNLNSLGPVALTTSDGTALTGGEIVSGSVFWLIYDTGASKWKLTGGGGSGSVSWGDIVGDINDQLDLQSELAGYQPIDGDLTTIAGLSPSNDDFLQRKSGAWTNRSISQVKTDLSLSGTNSGDQTITLTGDVTGSGTGSFSTTYNSTVPVTKGGTGNTTTTAYSVALTGTTSTGNFKLDTGPGTSGHVLTSNGAGAYPTWQSVAGGISGSGTTNEIAYFTGSSTLGSLTIGRGITRESTTLSNSGRLESYAYFPSGTAINWFGDSYTLSNQATNASLGFVSVFTMFSSNAMAPNNYAVSGTGWLRGVRESYVNVSAGNTNPTIVTLGFNDLRRNGNNVTANAKTLQKLKSAGRALIANSWLKSAIAANNASVTTTGTWTTTSGIQDKASLNLSGLVRQSTVIGSTLTYTFTLASADEGFVIGTFSTDESITTGGDFTYAIDGGSPVTYTGKNKTDGVSDGTYDNSICPNAIIVTGLSSGNHTVVITTTETATARIDYFGILSDPRYVGPIVINSLPKQSATGYATGAASQLYGSDAVFNQADQSLKELIAEFSNSYPLYFNDVNQYFSTSTGVGADNIHPNDTGYGQLAQSMISLVRNSGAGFLALQYPGQVNAGFFRSNIGDFIMAINRNPFTGTFVNTGRAAAQYQMNSSSGVGSHGWYVSSTNNIPPTLALSLNQLGNLSTGDTGSTTYRNTNGGADILANTVIDPSSSVSNSAARAWAFSTNDGFVGTLSNGSRRISGIALKTVNTTTTAGSEVADIGFFTKASGGAMAQRLQLGSTALTFSDAVNLVFNTSTGSKIGTATTQKIAFYNSTPIVQPGATTDLGTVLSDLGLRASGTAYPITTSGATTLTGRLKEGQGADVASVAGAIALGTDGNTFEITGTNAITLISNTNWQNGSQITLLFTSTATLTDGTANSGTDIGMELAGNTNFVASADDVVTLVLCEIGGTQRWREVSRSLN